MFTWKERHINIPKQCKTLCAVKTCALCTHNNVTCIGIEFQILSHDLILLFCSWIRLKIVYYEIVHDVVSWSNFVETGKHYFGQNFKVYYFVVCT